jgi:hypothetical protein
MNTLKDKIKVSATYLRWLGVAVAAAARVRDRGKSCVGGTGADLLRVLLTLFAVIHSANDSTEIITYHPGLVKQAKNFPH